MRNRLTRFLQEGEQSGNLQFVPEASFKQASPNDATPEQVGSVWEVTFVSTGVSKSSPPYLWRPRVLKQSVDAFNGIKVFAHRDAPHVPNHKKTTREIVGITQNARYEGDDTNGKIKGEIVILPSAKWLREDLVALDKIGKVEKVYRLSLDGTGEAEFQNIGGKRTLVPDTIMGLMGMAVVPFDAANSGFERMIQSQSHEGSTTMKQKLLTLFMMAYPGYLVEQNVDVVAVNENDLFTHLYQADKAQSRFSFPDGDKMPTETLIDVKIAELKQSATDATAKADADAKAARDKAEASARAANLQQSDNKAVTDMQAQLKAVQSELAQAALGRSLTDSKLPVPIQKAVKEQFEGRDVFTQGDIDKAIKSSREAYAAFAQSMRPNVPGQVDIQMGMDQHEKVELGLLGYFLDDPNALKPLSADERKSMLKGIPRYRSFKQAYQDYTGDMDITGYRKNSMRLTQDIGTADWAQVVADVMTKRLVRDYAELDLNSWRRFTALIPLSNFMTQHVVRYGGYANLPTVAEKAPYVDLTSPGDEEATYAATKKGGLESITREMIMNDNTRAIAGVPRRMARAAAQTLHEFVFGLVNPAVNALIYDGVALYDAAHGNTATTALGTDGVALLAARLKMKKQTDMSNSKRLGLRAGFLLHPSDLAGDVYKNLQPAYGESNQTPEFFQQLGIQPIEVDYWTDATDWALVARPEDIQGVEVGFVNGQEEPEIFVSDLTNVGSNFTNDMNTFKIRHEYGGAIIDYRAFTGNVVA